jgi:hypothetical protein
MFQRCLRRHQTHLHTVDTDEAHSSFSCPRTTHCAVAAGGSALLENILANYSSFVALLVGYLALLFPVPARVTCGNSTRAHYDRQSHNCRSAGRLFVLQFLNLWLPQIEGAVLETHDARDATTTTTRTIPLIQLQRLFLDALLSFPF